MPSVRKRLVTIVLISAVCSTGAVSAQTATATRQTRTASAEGLAAWQKIYSVLTHPRCLNCHTATNYPEQGEDRHRHQFNVVRGPEDRGVPGLTCGTCHQGATSKATGGPNCAECHKGADLSATGVPGGHGWHLAPLSMAWQDSNGKPLPSAQVCRVVTDRTKNENMGLDFDVPGMKVALIAHPPVFGAKVKSFDASSARKMSGVQDVFEVPLVRGSGIAVVADRFWTAKQVRDRLNVEWDTSSVEKPDSAHLFEKYRALAQTPGKTAMNRGDASGIDSIPEADRISAEFEFPFLAHTPMEPLNTTIRFDGDRAEVWAGSQFQTFDRQAVAETLGLNADQVLFHTEMAGGGFGRRAVADSHVQREAATIAKRMRGVPVKLIWTREDDVQGGYYRPMFVHRVEAGIGKVGLPTAWRHVIVGQSLLAGTPFAAMIKDGVDETAVEGTADTHYAIPNFHVSAHHPVINVPVLWWRSVGHTHNAFVMETLIDELATRAKADPFEYRLKLLSPDAKKQRACLTLLQEKTSSWHVPDNHAVGIACHESFGTGVACAVDVSIGEGRPRVHHAIVAVDPGFAVNPLTIESQMQGGITFGITQLMSGGAITLKDGRVEQRNWDGYTPPYMKDAPVTVDVHIVPSSEKPTGCGEPPVPVISPAIVNGLSRLTGKRYRKLPLTEI